MHGLGFRHLRQKAGYQSGAFGHNDLETSEKNRLRAMSSSTTPAELGFYMPPEWSPHAGTWLAWPHNAETWPGRLPQVVRFWGQLVATLCRFEPVHLLVPTEPSLAAEARRCVRDLPHSNHVHLHAIDTNDAWIRDFGPTFLAHRQRNEVAVVDWQYDAWGGKYPPYDKDQQATAQIARWLGVQRFAPPIVLEGGAFDVDGRGTVLVTESCLLEAGRNAGMTRDDATRWLAQYLNAPHAIWLGGGIAGDDTDGHVDQLVRFVGPHTVVAALEDDPHDENYEPLRENYERLLRARDATGRRLNVVPLPMPAPVFDGPKRLPASYANFYIANGAVLVPTFDDPADAVALRRMAQLFPDREICPLDSRHLVAGLGGIHCITQQQPRATAPVAAPCDT